MKVRMLKVALGNFEPKQRFVICQYKKGWFSDWEFIRERNGEIIACNDEEQMKFELKTYHGIEI